MKNLIQILTLSSISIAAVLFCIGANASEQIPNNYCLEVNGSKRYVDTEFSTKFPRTIKFKCQYECMINGSIKLITGLSIDTVRTMEEDARLGVCQGVKVKKVSWGYDYDGSTPFYAFDTRIKEIKEYAFDNINRDNSTEIKYLSKLKETLYTVVRGYAAANSPVFNEVAKELISIANELPTKTTLLDKRVEQIIKLKGNIQFALNVDAMVLTQIAGHAAWRIPSHKF